MHGSGLLKPSPLPCQHVLVGWACHTLPSWDGLRTGMADMGAVHDTCTLRSSSAESAFRANSSPAVPTESVTLRDGGHGSGVWPPSATH